MLKCYIMAQGASETYVYIGYNRQRSWFFLSEPKWHELIRIVKLKWFKWFNVLHKDVDIEAVACVHNLQYMFSTSNGSESSLFTFFMASAPTTPACGRAYYGHWANHVWSDIKVEQDAVLILEHIVQHLKLEGHSVERMYLRQRCFDGSLAQWIKPL